MSVVVPAQFADGISSSRSIRPLPPVPAADMDEVPTIPEHGGSVMDSSLSSSMSSSTPSISSSTTTDTSMTSADASLDMNMEQGSNSADDDRTISTPTASVFKNVDTSTHPSDPMDSLASSSSVSLSDVAVIATSTSSTSSIRVSSDSSNTNSSPSQPTLNVKFAPLPEMAPRKRKSKTPLGIAARGQLALRRRAYYAELHQQNNYPPQGRHRYAVGEEDLPPGTQLMRKVDEEMDEDGKAKERKKGKEKDPASVENDPLVVLAKKLNKAGKQIWRKVANKEGKDKAGKECHEHVKESEAEDDAETKQEKEGKEGGEEGEKQREELETTEGTVHDVDAAEVLEIPREEKGSPCKMPTDEGGLPMTMMTMSVMTTS